jgi:hypothetical protein
LPPDSHLGGVAAPPVRGPRPRSPHREGVARASTDFAS